LMPNVVKRLPGLLQRRVGIATGRGTTDTRTRHRDGSAWRSDRNRRRGCFPKQRILDWLDHAGCQIRAETARCPFSAKRLPECIAA
jgi:hypothetical protein